MITSQWKNNWKRFAHDLGPQPTEYKNYLCNDCFGVMDPEWQFPTPPSLNTPSPSPIPSQVHVRENGEIDGRQSKGDLTDFIFRVVTLCTIQESSSDFEVTFCFGRYNCIVL